METTCGMKATNCGDVMVFQCFSSGIQDAMVLIADVCDVQSSRVSREKERKDTNHLNLHPEGTLATTKYPSLLHIHGAAITMMHKQFNTFVDVLYTAIMGYGSKKGLISLVKRNMNKSCGPEELTF